MSKIGSAVSEEKSFENVNGRTDRCTDGRTDDGRKVITIAHPEQSSGELKINQDFSVNSKRQQHMKYFSADLNCNFRCNTGEIGLFSGHDKLV